MDSNLVFANPMFLIFFGVRVPQQHAKAMQAEFKSQEKIRLKLPE